MVFADTSALYAVLDRDDDNHGPAAGVWPELLAESHGLVTSNYVLVETMALVQSRLGMDALRVLLHDVVPVLGVRWITEEIHHAAALAVIASNRRRLSLVDCTSFEMMRRLGVRTAFVFDPHFAEQGFALLPPC